MSSHLTEHYQLHTWEPGDDFLRTEFNENFTAIDNTLAGKCELIMGSYVGNGEDGRPIDLGFTPQAVFICRQDGMTGSPNSYIYGGVFLLGLPLRTSSYVAAEITEKGFMVYRPEDHVRSNVSNQVYFYWAVR